MTKVGWANILSHAKMYIGLALGIISGSIPTLVCACIQAHEVLMLKWGVRSDLLFCVGKMHKVYENVESPVVSESNLLHGEEVYGWQWVLITHLPYGFYPV